jgi:hypothetical protein
MKILKYITLFTFLACVATGCKKDQFSSDTSFASSAPSATNLSVMFDITHDNTGVVTIIPNGMGAIKYDVYFGDATTAPVSVTAGKSVQHTYAEGNYNVKLVAYDIKGGTATITQALVVSFLTPQNLAVNLSVANLTATVSATAKYATLFKMSFGDSTAINPVPSVFALSGESKAHTYASAGTYIVTVTALSGGAETTTHKDTITISTPLDLPVTYENPNINYVMSDFGGIVSSLATDPVNPDNHVVKSIKTAGAQTWAGTTFGTGAGFATVIPITTINNKMTVDVYSPAVGLDIKLKLDNHANPNAGLSVETDVLTTKANQWETLTFDFSKNAAGTPAFNPSNTYDLASIFFDFNNVGTGSTFYVDNLQMAPTPVITQIDLPVTFESNSVDYTMSDFGGDASTLVVDPANANNHVMQTIKTSGSQTWAGTTIGTGLGFATVIPISSSRMKMTVDVYSPAVGLDIKLKLDNHANPNAGLSVETDVLTTKANQWETLTFDFSQNAAGTPAYNPANTYDLASIFFDFNNGGTGSVFYWDNVVIL